MGRFHQGKYTVKNKDKYVGDVKSVVYRSGYEKKVFLKLDRNPNILQWGSESRAIPYFSTIDNKIRRYFPDLWVKYKDKFGTIRYDCVEIKPYKQTLPPKKGGGKNSKRRYVNECLTYKKNKDKWDACEKWCDKNGWNFRLMTENEIFA